MSRSRTTCAIYPLPSSSIDADEQPASGGKESRLFSTAPEALQSLKSEKLEISGEVGAQDDSPLYNPSHVRRSIMNPISRPVDEDVDKMSTNGESASANQSYRSASLIFALPTIFPNSLDAQDQCRDLKRDDIWSQKPMQQSWQIPIERPTRKQNIQSIAAPSTIVNCRSRTIRSFNARLNSFAQKGNYDEVLSMIEAANSGEIGIQSPLNTYSYTILLKAYCNAGNLREAEALLARMQTFGAHQQPNRFTYNILLNASVRWNDMESASALFEFMQKSDDPELKPDHVTFTTLMKGYAASGDMDAAEKLFNCLFSHEDPLCRPNHVTYNTMLKGFAGKGDMASAEILLKRMMGHERCRPDVVSMNTIIGGYARLGDMVKAENLFGMMLRSGPRPNGVTIQAMVEGNVRIDNFERAQILHDHYIYLNTKN